MCKVLVKGCICQFRICAKLWRLFSIFMCLQGWKDYLPVSYYCKDKGIICHFQIFARIKGSSTIFIFLQGLRNYLLFKIFARFIGLVTIFIYFQGLRNYLPFCQKLNGSNPNSSKISYFLGTFFIVRFFLFIICCKMW